MNADRIIKIICDCGEETYIINLQGGLYYCPNCGERRLFDSAKVEFDSLEAYK